MTVALRDRVWTYEDYLALPDDGQRYEIIDGVLYVRPSPVTLHQLLSEALAALLRPLEGWVLTAPMDVLMPGVTPVQPDVIFLSREQSTLLQPECIKGVPKLLVEILSPGSVGHDRVTKMNKYASCGVEHYWILDPKERVLELFRLQDKTYQMLISLGPGDTFTHPDFGHLRIDLDGLYERVPPSLL